ncbi:hypothetical protein SAMN04488103_105185 [Gemmobacter aquatilis]|uniref:DUF5337 domain-containing protein n=1 Tax=Gemmobacter aquatilis TaxID=933059 RepID=A0A1H8GWF4_9RHOB|nr:DUF5337 domain-containing protein [Gemmobacter aquatilis]SEN48296.1 hypothetical protein SAMN04488103_105185 [Gemmobacter aquatilis]
MSSPTPEDKRQARDARTVALVIVGAMLLWLLAQGLGGMYGWDPRYAFLFDLAALAAFIWALVVTYQIWRRHKAAGRGN